MRLLTILSYDALENEETGWKMPTYAPAWSLESLSIGDYSAYVEAYVQRDLRYDKYAPNLRFKEKPRTSK